MIAIEGRKNPRCRKGKQLAYCGRTASSCGDWCPEFIKPIPQPITNLRQQIEEIIEQKVGQSWNESSKIEVVDRICEAIKAKVGGMPTVDSLGAQRTAVRREREACKSYLMGELE